MAMQTPLTPDNLVDILYDLFVADASLYNKIVGKNCISKSETEFRLAKVDVRNPMKIFIRAGDKETTSVRAQNYDYTIPVEIKVECLHSKPQTASELVEQAMNRMDRDLTHEIFAGHNFTQYFSQATTQCTIIDMTVPKMSSSVENENNQWRVHGLLTATFTINHTPTI